MDLSVVPYEQINLQRTAAEQEEDSTNTRNGVVALKNTSQQIKYKECMRNHAASIGGHANDGCGEFMPLATTATATNNNNNKNSNSLTCAACGCHRNFHRRELRSGLTDTTPHPYVQPPLLLYKNAVNISPSTNNNNNNNKTKLSHNGVSGVTVTVDSRYDDSDRRSETPERDLNVGPMSGRVATRNKRFRTKFTQEQKEKMLEFAERIGWRINRNDDGALNRFCHEIGIKRNVLKVWMHNNKNVHRRREPAPQPPVVAPRQPIGV